jgi:hypothetical protein
MMRPELRHLQRTALVAILAASLAGCARGAAPPPAAAPGPAEAARHRAALASITVVNNSSSTITILLRPAAPPRREVLLGTVPAGGSLLLPPVPAREPIHLTARAQNGSLLELPLRSFDIDEAWTWIVPAYWDTP